MEADYKSIIFGNEAGGESVDIGTDFGFGFVDVCFSLFLFFVLAGFPETFSAGGGLREKIGFAAVFLIVLADEVKNVDIARRAPIARFEPLPCLWLVAHKLPPFTPWDIYCNILLMLR